MKHLFTTSLAFALGYLTFTLLEPLATNILVAILTAPGKRRIPMRSPNYSPTARCDCGGKA